VCGWACGWPIITKWASPVSPPPPPPWLKLVVAPRAPCLGPSPSLGKGMWAVPDALMPTAFRHFLRAGGRVGLIDVGDVWLAPCPPQSAPKDSESCLDACWLHDAGLLLTPVLPQHADTILGHW
jgi:hypothetical protein